MIASIPVGGDPQFSAVSSDGKFVYVTVGNTGSVLVINSATILIVSTIKLNNADPEGICVSPDGKWIYVSNSDDGVSVINTATNLVTNTITVGRNPYGLSLTPDGSYLYVANVFANTVSVINTTTNTVTSTVNVGSYPESFGNFVTSGTGCSGAPVTFTITVNPTAPAVIVARPATGSISACAGTASVSPNIQQFTVSGSILTGNITATAPAGFEVSLSAATGYGSSVMLTPLGGVVNSTVVYVRSAATASAGNISGNGTLTSPGATSENVALTGTVNALPTVNAVANQQVNNGMPTTAINFTGAAGTYSWVNDTPGVGLAANGTGNIASFNAINKGGSPVTATITVTSVPTGFAYIANAGSNNVTVINTTTNTVVATITVGSQPFGVSVSRDGSSVYVTNKASNTVSVISTATNKVIATVPVGGAPEGLAVSPDGSTVYVANTNDGTVSVINTVTKAVSAIKVGNQPTGVAISPAGNRVYVSNYGDGTVSVINTVSDNVAATITIGPNPTGIAVSPDGTQLYVVSDFSQGAVTFINTATNAVTANVTFLADFDFAIEPAGLTVSPDGNFLYAPMPNGYGVQIIYTGHKGGSPGILTFTSIPFSSPYGVSELADGSEYYAVDSKNGIVYVVNTTDADIGNSLAVTGAIGVGTNPESFGNFITNGTGCNGTPVTFTITVNPTPIVPTITAGPTTGTISACAGTASTSPNIQQFTVSGSDLTADIVATAPNNFEVSLSAGSGFGNSVTLPLSGGAVNSTIVYVRSAPSAPTGSISGNVTLVSGTTKSKVPVTGKVNTPTVVNPVSSQTLINSSATTAINFTGTADSYNWTNDTPGIGLAATGTDNIPSFTAVNTGASPVIATITVTPTSAGYRLQWSGHYIYNNGKPYIASSNYNHWQPGAFNNCLWHSFNVHHFYRISFKFNCRYFGYATNRIRGKH